MSQRSPYLRRWMVFVSIMLGVLGLAACSTDLPATTLDPQGNHALRIYDLMIPMFWAALGVFIVVEGALVYTVFRYRRRPNAAIPAQVHGNTRVEILWTIAPALIVLVIAVLTFRTQALNSFQPPDALKVTAVGHQWWFEFQYPGEDVVTAGDMYIPVNRDVQITLESRDVIHSFWAPKLAGKTDMVPGAKNYLSFKAFNTGIFYAQCSVLCGESHANMAFRVVVVSQADYDSWLAQHKQAPPQPQGSAAAGSLVFTKKLCWSCHVIKGRPIAEKSGNTAPNLTYFGSRTILAAGVLPNTPENLAKWLHDPEAIKPGNLMSAVVKPGYLNAQEIADLVAYLEGMKIDVPLPAVASK